MKNSLKILGVMLAMLISNLAFADVAATHVYHNHMPNFWPYYDVTKYDATAVGGPVRYMYDGQVINAKKAPPANWYMLPTGAPMPHDDLTSYYTHHAKTGAYLSWPMDTAKSNAGRFPKSVTQMTMSAAVINNVQSFAELDNLAGYENDNWGQYWRDVHYGLKTTNGFPALDLVHFTGHHSMGPLVGPDYFLKDLLYHNVTLAQPYFLGSNFKSSKGFFPTELGFSERLIPTLAKLGIEWSVLGNNHYSRALKDYPYLNDPGIDTMVSPPNRADLQNTDSYNGAWLSRPMFNEQQVTQNKFPYASIPHWVQYVDPETGVASKIAGIPVEQAGSWEEGYQGSVNGGFLKTYDAQTNGRTQYFVVAHDGDNSSGRAGDGGTYANSGNVTYSEAGVMGMGVNEYLKSYPIPADDIAHVQDGSWIDTRDSSSDPQWHHWKLPPCIWKGQFPDFNTAKGFTYAPKNDYNGNPEGMTVSFEYGYHYLERNFALLQAAENYAKTAEQIWLADNPNHWKPTTAVDLEVVGKNNTANQLNPWMMSYPVKGNAAANYAGGANPAELAWYFLIPSIDSGFGYYDENIDDGVKPTISFNQSLHFSKPYVTTNIAKDKTGPSVWWPQRWPYNPGSVNKDKSEGWSLHYFDSNFGIYTYAYDVSGTTSVKLKVREHTYAATGITAKDKTYKVYNPSDAKFAGDANIVPSRVTAWTDYTMKTRDMKADINGVDWQPSGKQIFQIVKAQEIGNMYYAYLGPKHNKDYAGKIIDYYIEATDAKGNVTKSPIQQVYVGLGKYKNVSGKIVEDAAGTIAGTYPFVTDTPPLPPLRTSILYIESTAAANVVVQYKTEAGTWSASQATTALASPNEKYKTATLKYNKTVDETYARYSTDNGATWKPSTTGVKITSGTYTISAAGTVASGGPAGITMTATLYYKGTATNIHWRAAGGTWTVSPGDVMAASEFTGYKKATLNLGLITSAEACFNTNGASWDSNGGKNYIIPAGDQTFEAGVITAGKPNTTVDTTPPTVSLTAPAAGTVSGVVTVSATAADNVAVAKVGFYYGTTLISEDTTSPYSVSWSSTTVANGAYVIKAIAYDAAGNTATSTTVNVTVNNTDTTAPTVSLTAPAAGTISGTVAVSATATDNVAVTKVGLYYGTTLIAEDTTSPYSVNWTTTGVANGSYVLKAIAYDAAGNTKTSTTVTVTVNNTVADTTPPTVSLTAPAAGTISGTVAVSATAADNVGVTKVGFYYGTTLIAEDTTSPYSVNWVTTGVANGSYVLKAIAYDAAGNSTTSATRTVTVSNTVSSLKVHLKKPTAWGSAYVYYWNMTPALAAVTWPGKAMTAETNGWYVYTITGATSGNLIFSNNGSSQTADLTRNKEGWYKDGIWYDANPDDLVVPVATLTAPTTGTKTGTITVSATATDNVGVTKVGFYYGTTLIAEDTTSPYSVSWNTTAAANGTYAIKAVAYDAAGNAGTSSTVSVTVSNTTTGFKVHLYKPTAWTYAYIYYWNASPALAAVTWPGVAMTSEGSGWYVFTINANSSSIIFNNKGTPQTVDLTRNKEGWYKDGVWYDVKP